MARNRPGGQDQPRGTDEEGPIEIDPNPGFGGDGGKEIPYKNPVTSVWKGFQRVLRIKAT